MSEFLKAANFTNGQINATNDTTASGQTDIFGLKTEYGGGMSAGDYLRLTDAEALSLSDTVNVGTLFGGVYRRVKLASGAAATKRGQLLFWDMAASVDNYQVTNVEPTGASMVAGVFINKDTTGVTAGNWCWIQVEGRATVLYRAAVTKAGAIGDYVIETAAGAGADNATADNIADATNLTPVLARRFVGVAEEAPANAGLKRVHLQLRQCRT